MFPELRDIDKILDRAEYLMQYRDIASNLRKVQLDQYVSCTLGTSWSENSKIDMTMK